MVAFNNNLKQKKAPEQQIWTLVIRGGSEEGRGGLVTLCLCQLCPLEATRCHWSSTEPALELTLGVQREGRAVVLRGLLGWFW